MTEPEDIEDRLRRTLDAVARLPAGSLNAAPVPSKRRVGRPAQFGMVLVAAGVAAALALVLTVPRSPQPKRHVRVAAQPAASTPTPSTSSPPTTPSTPTSTARRSAVGASSGATATPSTTPLPAAPGSPPSTIAFGGVIGQPPTAADVVGGRVVTPVELDNGAFKVTPRLGGHLTVSAKEAAVLFGSDVLATAIHTGPVLGFGLVSVAPRLGVHLHQTPAWVGVLQNAVAFSCPAQTVPSAGGAVTPTPGYTAVIIVNPRKVFDYQSRNSPCGLSPTGPSAQPASEQISIPWQLVSLTNGTVTYRYRTGSCLSQAPSVSLGGNTHTDQYSMTVLLSVPFDRTSCSQTWRTANAPVEPPHPQAPPSAPITTIAHGPTGPVGKFRPLS
ncbi:MAG: hypothetical protein FWC87_04595 [Acidimicrobiaceae bacterium]|nr:hypothetical protein [Acidimicrobiaceae bacterium]